MQLNMQRATVQQIWALYDEVDLILPAICDGRIRLLWAEYLIVQNYAQLVINGTGFHLTSWSDPIPAEFFHRGWVIFDEGRSIAYLTEKCYDDIWQSVNGYYKQFVESHDKTTFVAGGDAADVEI